MKQLKKFILLLALSFLIMIISIFLTYYSSLYIHKVFDNPPVVQDLLWEKLPYWNIYWVAEILLILCIIVACIFSIKANKFIIPYAIIIISIFHILRAGLIILTPLGLGCYNGILPYGKNSIFLFGAFPSGHLSVPYLIYMVSKKKIFLLATFLTAFVLLVSHGHYSIDLVGTLLLGYPIFKFSELYLRKYFK